MKLATSACHLLGFVQGFSTRCSGEGHADMVPACAEFIARLVDQFELQADPCQPGLEYTLTSLTNKARYQERKRSEASEALENALGPRLGLRTQAIWFIRTGLADATLPAQTLSNWVREFPIEADSRISISYGSVSGIVLAKILLMR